MNGYKCNFIVPGFPKSGTSSLHEYLDLHPDICMSKPKETHFFAIDERYKNGPIFHNKIFERANDTQYRYYGESSTIYCIWKPALDRIYKNLINPKIIILLRDPVERLLSHYNWLWTLTLEKRPLLRAVKEEDEKGFFPEINLRGNYPCYLRASNYSYWCEQIINIFSEKNVFFLNAKDLFKEREKAVNDCFNFLDIDSISIKNEIHKNKTGEQGIQRTLGIPCLTRMMPKVLKDKIDPDRKIIKSVYSMFGKKKANNRPVVSERDLLEIRTLLNKDIEFYNAIFAK